ncbi:MAG: hypothetical protein ABID84_00310 [Chloroflexota bacterium]
MIPLVTLLGLLFTVVECIQDDHNNPLVYADGSALSLRLITSSNAALAGMDWMMPWEMTANHITLSKGGVSLNDDPAPGSDTRDRTIANRASDEQRFQVEWPPNPHQSSAGGIDICRICHRIDSDQSVGGLNMESEHDLCLSCHGHNASGAATDVEWGTLRGTDAGLRGGGFLKASMDTALTGMPKLAGTTSNHTIDEALIAWGYEDDDTNSNYGTLMRLRCISCHDPHGNGNYRSLRPQPLGTPVDSKAVYLADEANKDYVVKYTSDFLKDTFYVPANMSEWCAQCHTAYLAGPAAGSTDSGDDVFAYRHPTSLSGGCLSCHVAHGTTATMGPLSGAVTWPDGNSGDGSYDSRLLALNNRGVCMSCHADISGH